MNSFDVLIIGGGPGGLTCALTVCSAVNKTWFAERSICVIDDERSDLAKAKLFNAPGVPMGALGTDVLEYMRQQIKQYQTATFHNATAIGIERDDDQWHVQLQDGNVCSSAIIVIATGYKRWEMASAPIAPKTHPRGGKSDRIMLEHDGMYRIDEDLLVAGLLAGGSSQFAIATGIGAQVGVEILSIWAGKRTHVHDVPEPKEAGCTPNRARYPHITDD